MLMLLLFGLWINTDRLKPRVMHHQSQIHSSISDFPLASVLFFSPQHPISKIYLVHYFLFSIHYFCSFHRDRLAYSDFNFFFYYCFYSCLVVFLLLSTLVPNCWFKLHVGLSNYLPVSLNISVTSYLYICYFCQMPFVVNHCILPSTFCFVVVVYVLLLCFHCFPNHNVRAL